MRIIENKEELERLILEGYTIKQLQEYYACSRTTVTEAKKAFGLTGISPNSKKRDNGNGTKTCSVCGTVKSVNEFHSNGYWKGKKKLKPECKVCSTAKSFKSHVLTVISVLKDQGRECACELCGYNHNYAALCFHHLDPEEKDFEISSNRSLSADKLRDEIAKCALLCHNCHMEFHYPQGHLDTLLGGD